MGMKEVQQGVIRMKEWSTCGYPDERVSTFGHPDERVSTRGYPDESTFGYPDDRVSTCGYTDERGYFVERLSISGGIRMRECQLVGLRMKECHLSTRTSG
jgi:hypothetical protein